MSLTSATANLTAKLWASKTFDEAVKASYFNKFISESGDNVIHKYNDLSKNKGDAITIPLIMNLSGVGKSGDDVLEGYEEAITMYDFTVTVNQIRNAVRLAGEMTEQKLAFDLRMKAKNVLKQWFSDYLDNTLMTNLAASPTAGETLFAGTATATGTIAATMYLTTTLITKAKRTAMLHAPKVAPLKVEGKDAYILLAHPYAVRDLKANDTVWQNANYYAQERGNDNPILSGAVGMFDGVYVYEYERVPTGLDGGSSANVCYNMLLGKQAAVWAVAKPMFWKEKTGQFAFDYENSVGFATGYIGAIAKSKFNSKDYGIIHVQTGGAVG